MQRFYMFNPEDFAEVRQKDGATILLTEEDLAAEKAFNAEARGDLESNPRINEVKAKVFGQGTHFNAPNLTDDEKDVLCHIGASTSGQKIVDSYTSTYAEIKSLYDIGAAFVADDLKVTERVMSQLPELLDGLVKKGAIVENPELKEENSPSSLRP